MADLAEKILEAIEAVADIAARAACEGTGKWAADDPSFWFDDEHPMDRYEKVLISLHDPDSVARRCAADREMVEIYKGALVAVEVSKDTILAGATKVRLGAYQKMIDQLARGYGIQP